MKAEVAESSMQAMKGNEMRQTKIGHH